MDSLGKAHTVVFAIEHKIVDHEEDIAEDPERLVVVSRHIGAVAFVLLLKHAQNNYNSSLL